jgi:hypothetical protein
MEGMAKGQKVQSQSKWRNEKKEKRKKKERKEEKSTTTTTYRKFDWTTKDLPNTAAGRLAQHMGHIALCTALPQHVLENRL